MSATAAAKAQTLIEAAPYIRSFSSSIVVVKLGGETLEDPDLASATAGDLSLLAMVGVRVVIVHGGGPQISRAMVERGLQPRFVDGRRITDEAAMEVVQEVLVGRINADLVRGLNRAGARAVGLSGVDGGLISAARLPGALGEDLGFVGSVSGIAVDLLLRLLDGGFVPVVAPVAASGGEVLNVNADSAASAIARALPAEKLVYMTNVEGLYRDLGDRESLISEMKKGDLAAMTKRLSAGMKPKAEAAVEALDGGVGKVHMLDGRVRHALLLEIFTPEGIGTQVVP